MSAPEMITDVWGNQWAMAEERATKYGYSVFLGRPYPKPKGWRGGAQAILTTDLLKTLDDYRMRPIDLDLPLGSTTIKRLRSAVGMMWYEDKTKWWKARLPEMATMSATDFAHKYGLNVATACLAMIRYFGYANRPPGWWREKGAVDMLLSKRPTKEIAAALDIAPSSVRRLRSDIIAQNKRDLGLTDPQD